MDSAYSTCEPIRQKSGLLNVGDPKLRHYRFRSALQSRIQLLYNVYIMGESSVLTLRLNAKLKNQLDRLSKAMNRSRSFVAAQAIEEFVSLNEWQIAEIKKAIGEADRSDFASDKQVQQSLKRWMRRAR